MVTIPITHAFAIPVTIAHAIPITHAHTIPVTHTLTDASATVYAIGSVIANANGIANGIANVYVTGIVIVLNRKAGACMLRLSL